MGGGGDNVHANAASVFCFLLLFPMCRISHRFLRCFCRLSTFCTCQLRLAFVFQLCAGVRGGWGGGGDDVHANAASVFCFFCCVTSQTLPVALRGPLIASLLKRQPCKNLAFLQLSRQKLRKRRKKINLKKARKAWYLRHVRKNATNKQEQKTWENENADTSCC